MKKSVLALCVSLLLAACADRDLMPIVPEAVNIGTPYTVFSTTTREQEADGTFGFRRSEELRMVEMTVTIPPSHSPGELSYRYKNPDPRKNFTIAQELPVDSVSDLRARFLRELPGSLVMYSWPSRGRAFGYAYDIDSMLFARDGLEETVRRVKQAGAERIILVAHSMGTALAMEMLRQADLRNPGWAARTLNGGVILISPDLDVDVFDSQMMELKRVPQPFAVMVSEKDRILNISGRLRGTSQGERLGNIKSADRLERWPIEVIDLTAFNADAASGHFVAATSPSLLAVLRSASNVSRVFGPVDPSLLQQILPQSQTITNEHGKLMLERQQRREER